MIDRLVRPDALELPPRDAWLINPAKEKIPPPTDEFGFILIDEFFDLIKESIDPSYEWRRDMRNDIHHFYWEESDYPYVKLPGVVNPRKFRELSTNKGLMSREFHNWTHIATEKPRKPSDEAMLQQIQAYLATKNLYIAAQLMVSHDRLEQRRIEEIKKDSSRLAEEFDGVDVYGAAYFAWERARRERAVRMNMGRLATIPEAFRLTEVETDEVPTIARKLGKVVATDFRILTRRAKLARAA